MFLYYTVDYPSLTISLPTVPVVLSGDPVMLSCIVMETTPGLTDASIVFWIDPYSNVVVHTPPDMNVTHQSLNDLTTRSTVSLAAATTSAAGTYSCVASLTTPAFHIRSLFFSKEELLPVQSKCHILFNFSSPSHQLPHPFYLLPWKLHWMMVLCTLVVPRYYIVVL